MRIIGEKINGTCKGVAKAIAARVADLIKDLVVKLVDPSAKTTSNIEHCMNYLQAYKPGCLTFLKRGRTPPSIFSPIYLEKEV